MISLFFVSERIRRFFILAFDYKKEFMFRNLILASIILLGSLPLYAQNQKPLVKIGDDQISAEEFKLRYELFPFIDTGFPEDTVKFHFLLSLIAEKLCAIEAKNLGMEGSEKFDFYYLPLEKMFVRDALFQREIKSKVKIDNDEVLKGDKKYGIKLKVIIFGCKDSSRIYKIYQEAKSGISVDSLSGFDDKDTSEVTFGSMNFEAIEDSLFLLSIGEYTKPLKTESGWFIFYLNNKTKDETPEDPSNITKKVEDIVRDRHIAKAYKDYMWKVFKDKKIEANKNIFLNLSENVFNFLKEKQIAETDTSFFYLDESDIEKLKVRLGNKFLEKTFFTVNNKHITVRDFLADMLLERFSIDKLTKEEVYLRLSELTKEFIEKEYLTDLGYKEGLQNLPEVKNQLQMWKDNYLAKIYQNTLLDSARVNDKETYDYFLKKQKGDKIKQVNIVELLTDSLETIKYVLNQMRKGKDFKDLAAKLTKREGTKNKGGEFGFFPVTSNGEIGKIADNMKIGDIYGPIKVKEGYSMFQLIDVKETEDSIRQSFDEVKNNLKTELMNKKFQEVLNNKLLELAKKYKVNIDEGVFKSIHTTNIKMFVHRFMGFGGRIAVVPFATPLYQWFYKKKSTLLP